MARAKRIIYLHLSRNVYGGGDGGNFECNGCWLGVSSEDVSGNLVRELGLDMKRWYVVQVYTGLEDRFRVDLLSRVKEAGLEEFLDDVVVPSGMDSLSGNVEKAFPGYVLIHAEMSSEVQSFISKVPRLIKFIGGEPPAPLGERDVKKLLENSIDVTIPVDVVSIAVGSEVKINKGPFSGFTGIVEEVDEEQRKLRVAVSIFGRMTPIDIGMDQIER